MILLLVQFVGGCVQNTGMESSEIQIETIKVIDSDGREVEVPKEVERIATLFSVSGHVVTLLGKGENIVAVGGGLQRDLLLLEICPTIKDAYVPKVSGDVNGEELAKSRPDVALVDRDIVSSRGETEVYDKLGIPYLVVDFNSIEDQQNMVSMVGKVVGAEEKAAEYIQYYNESIEMVYDRVKNIPEDNKLRVYHSTKEATRTTPAGSLPVEWLKKAGGISVSATQDLRLVGNNHYTTIEQILLWDPDVIFVNDDGIDEYIMNHDHWKNLKAVQEEKVYLLPNGVSRWGHPNSIETPLVIIWAAKTLYPDYFQDIDMVDVTKKFYNNFFNYHLTDEQVQQLLSGKNMRTQKE